ncbi:hypothetical protein [Crocosphaera sp.]|uniref:hypothetical protein n=1 Tax=Crocosphaera sp. TaxID=2729996 RepID=UPI0026102542|nr:hypothetical protein [Crocosphaera sp.]MDJ0578495.1 hypothetical protein [Crocosphaera sp.]
MAKFSKDKSSGSSGLSLRELQKLPKEEQHLINWIRRQKQPSLLDIAIHLCQDEETALNALQPLLEKGFVEETIVEEERHYRVTYPPKKGKSLFKKLADKKKAKQASSESSTDS